MSRINPIDLKTTHDGTRRNFTAIEKQLGALLSRELSVHPGAGPFRSTVHRISRN